jgi:putative flippase GtrA
MLRYGAFAALATLANLAAQRLVLAFLSGPGAFVLALFVGTAVGLVLKYLLDKRWIFFDRTTGVAAHRRTFTLYTVMGLITTAVFWGTETAFWLVWRTDLMREVGAIIGLAGGYLIKFDLDRRFVFNARMPAGC